MVTNLVKNCFSDFNVWNALVRYFDGQPKFKHHSSSYKQVTELEILCNVNRPFVYILKVEVKIIV